MRLFQYFLTRYDQRGNVNEDKKKIGNPHSTFDDVANVHKDSIRRIFEFMGKSDF